ncbi:MAG: peroxidase [Planctomycetes bacterium]|nr:peroxidase [Planctomycetota bacterium]
MTRPEQHDVQALVGHGFSRLKAATYLLLRIADADPAQRWLATLPLTTVAEADARRGLQLALTASGLRALGVGDQLLQGFAAEFLAGMADPGRSRRLGDVDGNAPQGWSWGGNPDDEPHVLLALFARPGDLDDWQRELTTTATQRGLQVLTTLASAELDDREPFGFVDGISQPELDWDGTVRRTGELDPAYHQRIALGEFLLGYPNEYGQYTDRPLVEDPGADLPDTIDPDHAGAKDLGRNGTYLVFRHLAQDVRGFWRFLDRVADGDAARRQHLAELMVGRRLDGRPLAGLPDDFTFAGDPDGRLAPLGSHIRRANPRNGDLPPGNDGWLRRLLATFGFGHRQIRGDLVAASRFHRILRRGRDYGPQLSLPDALAPASAAEPERGLYFIGLNASLARQFEFVQGAWLASGRFDGREHESDPLVGTRDRGDALTAGAEFRFVDGGTRPQRLRDLPRFVQVRGGAYFFLPGIRAARHLLRARAQR